MVWYVSIILYLWGLFKLWLTTLFITPFKFTDMLWLLIPIWTTWFFAEFFQEKHGTSMGNAITNSVVVIWGSIDCTRQTVSLIGSGVLTAISDIIFRFTIIVCILGYGITIIFLGLTGHKIIKYIGRVREVTYAFAMFTPVFYNATPLTVNHIIAVILFFPLFYFAIELIDRYTPNPKAVDAEFSGKDEGPKEDSSIGAGSGLGSMESDSTQNSLGNMGSGSNTAGGGNDDFKGL